MTNAFHKLSIKGRGVVVQPGRPCEKHRKGSTPLGIQFTRLQPYILHCACSLFSQSRLPFGFLQICLSLVFVVGVGFQGSTDQNMD